MRVLVTGAGGFIGVPAIRALVSLGHDVHGVYRSNPPQEPGVVSHIANLLDDAQTRRLIDTVRPEAILHIAWFVEHGLFWHAPENLDWMAATLRLARHAAAARCRRFVGVGTCFEYAISGMARCDELTTPITPETLYGIAKDSTRRTLEAYTAAADMPFAWARLFYIYGPREGPGRLIPSLALKLLAGQPAPMGSGNLLRDYIHVDDCGLGLATLVASPVTGPVNIGRGEGVAIVSIARRLAELSGRPELLRVGAMPDRPGDPPAVVAIADRLKHEVGAWPQISLDQGLRDCLTWWGSQCPQPALVHR